MKRFFAVCAFFLLVAASASAAPLEIRTSLQNSVPKYMATESGEHAGICVDIMKAIEKVDPEIRFVYDEELIPFARIARYLEAGEIDVFFGMVWNEERDSLFTFVQPPLYPTYNLLVVRADDPVEVESLDDIRAMGNDGIILVDRATAHQAFLEEQGGLVIDAASDRSTNLTKLLGERGRFYYSTDIGLMGTIGEMELEGKIRFLPLVLVEDFQYAAFFNGFPEESRERVVKALEKLQEEGVLAEIRAKYIK